MTSRLFSRLRLHSSRYAYALASGVAPSPTPAPAFTTQPTISDDGTPMVGETLTGNDGVITNGTVSARQWLLNGSAISGANGATYVPTAAGDHSYRVTATGAGGSTTATSAAKTVAAAPAPTPTFSDTVFTGDSITVDGSSYANQYRTFAATAYPTKNIYTRAQGSRQTGALANLNDGGNTLFGQMNTDFAGGIKLAHRLIGANDLRLVTLAAYRTNQIDYKATAASLFPDAKLVWSVPFALNPNGTHPDYVIFNQRRDELRGNGGAGSARDPAVWSQYGHYYSPMGENPDIADAVIGPTLFTDTIHPNASGHTTALNQNVKPFMNTLFDVARVNSAVIYNAAWPTDQGNIGPNQTIVVRFPLSGLAWNGITGNISVSGSGSPRVRVNGGAWGANAGATWLYNGDVADMEITLGAAGTYAVNLTIGGETRTITFTAVAQTLPSVQPGTMPRTGDMKLFLRADDVSSIKQGNDGTGAITATGQPARYFADVSGNGFHLSAVANSGTACPTFRYDGTTGYLEIDGADDALRRLAALNLPAAAAAGGYTIMALLRKNSPGAAGHTLVMEGNSANAGPIFAPFATVASANTASSAWYRDDAGANVLNFASTTSSGAYDGSWHILCQTDDGAQVINKKDGVAGLTRTYTRGSSVFTLNQFAIGCTLRTSATNFTQMDLGALAVWFGAPLSNADQATASALFAKIRDGG